MHQLQFKGIEIKRVTQISTLERPLLGNETSSISGNTSVGHKLNFQFTYFAFFIFKPNTNSLYLIVLLSPYIST